MGNVYTLPILEMTERIHIVQFLQGRSKGIVYTIPLVDRIRTVMHTESNVHKME